jgi:hypothetical protein
MPRDHAKHNIQRRQRYATDPEYRERLRVRSAEYRRRVGKPDPDAAAASYLRNTHGLDRTGWATIWENQDGRCYLCGGEFDPAARNGSQARAVVDHVHGHCGRVKSCPACRRGLACDRCNRIIGTVGDDPDLLLQIAANLATANAAAASRIAAVPPPIQLFD